ncbi:hypothetical protein [Parvicella tangerina]|nr:hypothetical protein [Parvicella tangerina]
MIQKVFSWLAISTLSLTGLAQSNSSVNEYAIGFCGNEDPYAVKSFKEFFSGQNEMPNPDKEVKYKGGAKKIEKYLNERLDLGDSKKMQIIPVYVVFDVNCEGETGNYEFQFCEECENKEFFEKQLIQLFNELPQNWTAAKHDGHSVDCRQVMSFSINLNFSDEKKNGVANLNI